jgi:hypothetical protein
VRELGRLRRRDRYEMIATFLLYLQPMFELGGMNTCGSVVVRIDVCFVAAAQKCGIIISNNVTQSPSRKPLYCHVFSDRRGLD